MPSFAPHTIYISRTLPRPPARPGPSPPRPPPSPTTTGIAAPPTPPRTGMPRRRRAMPPPPRPRPSRHGRTSPDSAPQLSRARRASTRHSRARRVFPDDQRPHEGHRRRGAQTHLHLPPGRQDACVWRADDADASDVSFPILSNSSQLYLARELRVVSDGQRPRRGHRRRGRRDASSPDWLLAVGARCAEHDNPLLVDAIE